MKLTSKSNTFNICKNKYTIKLASKSVDKKKINTKTKINSK